MKKAITLIAFYILGVGSTLGWYGSYMWLSEWQSEITVFDDYTIEKEDMTKTVNEWSLKNKGYEYEELPTLCEFAKLRVKEIENDWSHDGFRKLTNQIRKDTNAADLGENLAKDFADEPGVLTGWLNSPPHRKVLDHPYTHMCIETDGNHVVQLFATF